MSEVKVNKVTPRSGTTLTIGDSGDTTNVVGTLQNNGAALVGDISSVVAGTNLSGGGTSGAVTINLADASTSAKGAASFSSDNFAASSGVITIKDLGVTTAELLDNAVTTDKLANSISTAITANTNKVTNATHSGEVTGSGALTIAGNVVDEANLKVSNNPTNGYMLTAQSGATGGLTWAEASSGAMTLISTNTLSSTVANVTVSGMDSTYKNYKVIVSGLVPQDDNYTLFARTIVGGSIVTDNYYSTEFTQHENATGDNGKSINTNSWKIIGNGANYLGKNSGENTNIEMTFFDPSNTSLRTMVSCVTTYQTDDHAPGFTDSALFYDTTSALQGVNFIMSNGNITAGTFKLYGIS